MKYNWQQSDWLDFRYDVSGFQDVLFSFAERTGHIEGMLKSLPDKIKDEAIINLMVSEAIKTSEIEGEYFSRADVMLSIRQNLGLEKTNHKRINLSAKGIADLMIDVRDSYDKKLTEKKLFDWHNMLFVGQQKSIKVGAWRSYKDAMQIISGPIGRYKIHFEAPASDEVPAEMRKFINWFNRTAPNQKSSIKNPVIRSAITHLYFETIHPFEDGNGRIGRALAEKALSQSLGRPIFLSLSETIEKNKKAYYNALKKAQQSNEITPWLLYFSNLLLSAQIRADKSIVFILAKAKLFDRHRNNINSRQLKVINRMLKNGIDGFTGGMSTKKYITMTGVSKATTVRDLQHLTTIGIFKKLGGGRSTRYEVNLEL